MSRAFFRGKNPPGRPEWAARIRELRGMRTQVEFSRLCGVSQVTVSRWESGADEPAPSAYARLAKLANEPYLGYFSKLSGLPPEYLDGPKLPGRTSGLNVTKVPGVMKKREAVLEATRQIPFMRDAAYACTRSEDEEESRDGFLTLPAIWFDEESHLCAFTISGRSMEPIMNDESIVIVDTSIQNPNALVGSMVAFRTFEGAEVKWLRGDKGVYLLVPQCITAANPVVVLESKDAKAIIGKVVRWIGVPPTDESDLELD